jgi:hypothetical protein
MDGYRGVTLASFGGGMLAPVVGRQAFPNGHRPTLCRLSERRLWRSDVRPYVERHIGPRLLVFRGRKPNGC